jgi:DNA-binding CsgD family transcriptional regulator
MISQHALEVYSQQTALRKSVLDSSWRAMDASWRGLCAEMLLHLQNPVHCWQMLTEKLIQVTECDRIDAGYCAPALAAYKPQAQAIHLDSRASSVLGLLLPNQMMGIQAVWQSRNGLMVDDLGNDSRIEPELRQILQASGTKRLMAWSIWSGHAPVGLVCMDQIDRINPRRGWSTSQIDDLRLVLFEKIAPILHAANEFILPSGVALLSKAEREVAAHVVMGKSYKTIAHDLDKAFSTIDHQMRAIRQKLKVRTNAELIRKLLIANIRD